MTTRAERASAYAREELLKILKPGDTVYTILRHVSRSGMYRVISVIAKKDDELVCITGTILNLKGMKWDSKHYGLGIHGCGMDVGFEVVYNLSYELFKHGFVCIGDNCPSNDHFNGDRDYTPHKHSDPGYALRHKWL